MQKGIIGIFDSGLGGLSIAREVRTILPSENILYVGDCGNAPYGDKTEAFVIERVLKISDFFLKHNAKAIVVACNTATAAAIDILRTKVSIPVIGVEPALKPAVLNTKTGAVGVMATTRTISSKRYQKLLNTYNPNNKVKVVSMKCSGLMNCVENGAWDAPETIELIEKYTKPIKEANADFTVLGCTHYPFLKKQISKALGPNVTVYDPSPAVATQVLHQLEKQGSLELGKQGTERFLITSLTPKTQQIISLLWGKPVSAENLEI